MQRFMYCTLTVALMVMLFVGASEQAQAGCTNYKILEKCYKDCERLFDSNSTLREYCKLGCYIGCWWSGR